MVFSGAFSKSQKHHEYHDMLQVLMRKGGLYAKLVMTLVYRAIVDLPYLCEKLLESKWFVSGIQLAKYKMVLPLKTEMRWEKTPGPSHIFHSAGLFRPMAAYDMVHCPRLVQK